jgi:NADP-dependent 3-hydroxy acid dehydrogenase YdfG
MTNPGSSSGIGQKCAETFASLGCCVSITGRSEENVKKTKELCIKAGITDKQVHLHSLIFV